MRARWWNWTARRGPITALAREPDPEPQPVMSGRYLLLYNYLHNRYADTVVLTFGQIESLIGFALPDQARFDRQWWSNPKSTAARTSHSDAWVLARRVATPNLPGQTVVFERAS
jgi:hypothetical protein